MPEADDLVRLAANGQQAAAELFSEFRPRLERMVEFRMDRRLYGRLDPADVLQDAFIEVSRRLDDYLASPSVSFYVWVRQITWQALIACHRHHFGQKRHPNREANARREGDPTTRSLVVALAGAFTSPSQIMMRDEEIERLRSTLQELTEIDREVLALRHFEQLGNREVAEVLGLSATAASNRYIRALKRLTEAFTHAASEAAGLYAG